MHVVSPQEKPNLAHAAKEKEMLHVGDTAVALGFPFLSDAQTSNLERRHLWP